MTYLDFFREAPVLATLLTLGYLALWGAFIYMLVRMHKRPLR